MTCDRKFCRMLFTERFCVNYHCRKDLKKVRSFVWTRPVIDAINKNKIAVLFQFYYAGRRALAVLTQTWPWQTDRQTARWRQWRGWTLTTETLSLVTVVFTIVFSVTEVRDLDTRPARGTASLVGSTSLCTYSIHDVTLTTVTRPTLSHCHAVAEPGVWMWKLDLPESFL